MSNTKDIGDISEAKILARLVELGFAVLSPFGDNKRYDYVIDRDGKFERIQVKTGKVSADGSVISFPTSSSQNHVGRGRVSYVGQIEHFGVYCPQNDSCYLVPVDVAPLRLMKLRLTASKNGQVKNVNFAKDYSL